MTATTLSGTGTFVNQYGAFASCTITLPSYYDFSRPYQIFTGLRLSSARSLGQYTVSSVPLTSYANTITFNLASADGLIGDVIFDWEFIGVSVFNPTINITCSTPDVTLPNGFNVTLTDTVTERVYIESGLPFGYSQFVFLVPQSTYTVAVSPATAVGSNSVTFDAPAPFNTSVSPSEPITIIYVSS